MKVQPVQIDQSMKVLYDRVAKESAEEHQPAGIIGLISGIIGPTFSNDSDAERLAEVRYVLTAYEQAREAYITRLRKERYE